MRNVLAIVGPRRAGKTYLMFQYIEDLLAAGHSRDDILFIDFEDYRLRDFGPDDTDSLLAAFEQLTGKPPGFLFFDQVQRLPSWSRVPGTLHNRRKHVIVVSGSNSELLTREVATELHGRYEDQLVMPFSMAERLRHAGVPWTETTLHTAGRGRLMKVFDDYLLWGGYPEVIETATPQENRRSRKARGVTLRMPLVRGRHLTKGDRSGAQLVDDDRCVALRQDRSSHAGTDSRAADLCRANALSLDSPRESSRVFLRDLTAGPKTHDVTSVHEQGRLHGNIRVVYRSVLPRGGPDERHSQRVGTRRSG